MFVLRSNLTQGHQPDWLQGHESQVHVLVQVQSRIKYICGASLRAVVNFSAPSIHPFSIFAVFLNKNMNSNNYSWKYVPGN